MALDRNEKVIIAIGAGGLALVLAYVLLRPARKPDEKLPPPPAPMAEPPPPAPPGAPPPLQKSQGDDVKDILNKAVQRPDPEAPR